MRTCLPGDVVLGTIEGVVFIPPHLATEVAGGRATSGSDIDFAVRGCPASEFYNLQGKLLLELTRPADLIDLDADADLASFLEREATLIHVR